MARGFIRGVLWGAGVSLGAVTLVSVAVDGPETTEWQRTSSVVTAERDDAAKGTIGSSGNRLALTGAEAPMGQGPSPDTLQDIAAEAFDPADVPETGLASDLPLAGAPQPSSSGGIPATETKAPTVASTAQRALTTPATEPDLSISTEPAQPPAPAAVQQATAFEDPEATLEQTVAPPEPALQVAETVTDPLQPVTPDVPESSGVFAENEVAKAGSQTTSAEADNDTPSDETEVATGPADVDATGLDAPVVMADAPDVVQLDEIATRPVASDATETVNLPETEAPDASVVDAPQPQAATEIVVALAELNENGTASLPQITSEADVPDVVDAQALTAPDAEVDEQSSVDKTSAEVTASVALDAPVAAPQTLEAVVVAPAADEEAAPELTAAPQTMIATAPDRVAKPQLTSMKPVNIDQATNENEALVEEVKVNRLPTLSDALGTQPEPDVSDQAVEEMVSSDQNDLAPVIRYAQPFENPDSKPAMAIVLMDDGVDLSTDAIGLPALRALPYPVTFAVDADLPDAADRMRAYRNEGFEVLAMIDFPQGATATDAEVNLSVALNRLPQVVGVLEGVKTGVQTTRDSGRQVAQILAQTGHGFVTQNKGLNTVQKLAARQGVPSGVVFRDFDSKGQSSRVIARFLDQAAFRAGQEGGVIMLGRMREQTIAALMVWALQDRASQVALAPVTGALRTQAP